jgi:histidinol-phosphate aminotransferase
MDLLLGNGSDELIQIITMALARPGAVALVVEPTFPMYAVSAVAAGMALVGVPLQAQDFSLDLEAVETALERNRPAVTFIAWPNNPTGSLYPRADVERIVRSAPGLVVLDEAYFPFSGETFMPDLARHENLLVLRTLSKQGLAGLRLGFLAGHTRWLEQFEKIRPPYNVGTLAQVSAAFFLDRMDVFADQAGWICGERSRLSQRLAALPRVTLWPGSGNFLMFRVDSMPAVQVFDGLKTRGILIKLLDGAHPLLAGCLRVSVGRREENDAFLDALAAVLDGR